MPPTLDLPLRGQFVSDLGPPSWNTAVKRSLPPNTIPTATTYGNEPEGQPRLCFPMYAGVGVTPVWSSSVTLLPFSSPATPDPSPSVVQPGLPCTPESNQQLVRYAERPHSSYPIRPYTRPTSEGQRPTGRTQKAPTSSNKHEQTSVFVYIMDLHSSTADILTGPPQSLPLGMTYTTCKPRHLCIGKVDVVPSIRILRDLGLAFSLTIQPADNTGNFNVWADLHRAMSDRFGSGNHLSMTVNADLASATPASSGWCPQAFYKAQGPTSDHDSVRYLHAVNRTMGDRHLQISNFTLTSVKRWSVRVGPNSTLDMDPFHSNRENHWTLFVAPSTSNMHGKLTHLFQRRPDLQLPIADLKREHIHSCYLDTILACLPFFWRNIGRAPNSDLSEHPPFLHDDEDENAPPSPCPLAQLMDVDEESIQVQASTSPIDDLAYPVSDYDTSEVNESEPIRDPRLSQMLPSIQVTAGPPPFELWREPSNTAQIYHAQRRVQRASSNSLLSAQYLRIEARTPAEAGRAIHMCLVELYKRCFHLDMGMYLDGVADESDFPRLPIINDVQPPNHWNYLRSYSDPDLRIHSDHAEDTAIGSSVTIQVHAALVEFILDSPCYTDSRFGKYKIPVFPSRVYNQSDLAVWRADGAAFSLYAGHMGFPINDLHPVFLLTLLPLPGRDPLKYLGDLTGPILQSLDRRLCDSIRPWFYLAPTDPISNTLEDPVLQALIGLQTQLQAHHIGLRRSRTLQEHVMQMQDLISELVIGNTTFWQTEAFQQMRQGFHQAFNEMLPELTIPRAFTGASCGPLNAITYVYDCEPRTPTKLFDYIEFGTSPPSCYPDFPRLCDNFHTELFSFLSEDIERSKVLLYVMSGSKNLPRWNLTFTLTVSVAAYIMDFRQTNGPFQFEFNILPLVGSIFVHACLKRTKISWDSVTDTILAGNHGEITPKAWLEAMFTGVAGYNMLGTLQCAIMMTKLCKKAKRRSDPPIGSISKAICFAVLAIDSSNLADPHVQPTSRLCGVGLLAIVDGILPPDLNVVGMRFGQTITVSGFIEFFTERQSQNFTLHPEWWSKMLWRWNWSNLKMSSCPALQGVMRISRGEMLMEDQINIICGVYKVEWVEEKSNGCKKAKSDHQGQLTEHVSWFPKPMAWKGSGLDIGFWSANNEFWYLHQVAKYLGGDFKCKNQTEWRKSFKLCCDAPMVSEALKTASCNFLEKYILSYLTNDNLEFWQAVSDVHLLK
ncbi:hypothetical protein F5146DRAFT_1005539 [Armillaria mellea]|nr:hypothetical protein F5146DRAFT_1005539 [Armillaria mellea]